jgi:TetR/AcrR family transcriptional regulator, mexJK operon transcriptional repressor
MRYINATQGSRHFVTFAILVSMQAKTARQATRKAAGKKRRSTRGRPPAHEVATRAENLLDVATEVFLAQGFKGASMSEIARRAGASKQTLYTRYPSKAALFAALVERKASHLFEAIGPLGEGRTLRETLVHCGSEMLDLILSKDARGVHRVVIAECVEFPELGELFWDRGPGRVRAMLANYLRAQQKFGNIHCGDLGCGNPEQAVEVFLGLLVSGATLRASLGLPPTFAKTQAQRKAWANYAVDMFLSAMQANASR